MHRNTHRKAYVPGAAVLLAALLAACTGGSGSNDSTDDSKAGDSTTSATAAQPGRFTTLSDACTSVGHSTLDSLLPGLKKISDEEAQDKAYAGTATLTYNNDRRSGCSWKAESSDATDRLLVDFERVVSYDAAVSDDTASARVFAAKQDAADIPKTTASSSSSSSTSSSSAETSSSSGSSGTASATPSSPTPSDSSSASATAPATPSGTPTALQPRTLGSLGDEAFLNDELSSSDLRTVTVAFRTSNVIVTVQYAEQPTATGEVPDSEEMQGRAQNLAKQLADSLGS
ncbi:hypothetical protein OK074_4020 [Actinobacteria bacterium OK074]|nr:hypothetical protein OK074_4020 [Actinobacteria bacterium OK074]